jgi:uracil-DNA glycosylase family 4
MSSSPLAKLSRQIVDCEKCPRLRRHCTKMAREKRKAYADETYWGRPIHGFGDPRARFVIVGLAPAAHGANRTGRIFTGDRSGLWLYRALHRAGFANQFSWERRDDGLELRDAYITCAVKCAPPDNKPDPGELTRCRDLFLERELELLDSARVYLALGQIGMNAIWNQLAPGRPRPKFGHGAHVALPGERHLLLSYHPSQQNTFTGRLTEPMFDAVFSKARELLAR